MIIDDDEALSAGCWFNYDDPQWSSILAATKQIVAGTFDEKRFCGNLLKSANDYLRNAFEPPSEQARAWADVSECIIKLRLLVAQADRYGGFLSDILTKQLEDLEDEARARARQLNGLVHPGFTAKKYIILMYLKFGHLSAVR